MVLANEEEDHADCEFGDGGGGVGGDADDGEGEGVGGGEVDVVEPGAAEGDEFLDMLETRSLGARGREGGREVQCHFL